MNSSPFRTLIGPFAQILPMTGLPRFGPIKDAELLVIPQGGLVVEDGIILDVGRYHDLQSKWEDEAQLLEIEQDLVAIPGLIDAHTHICFGGSRAMDYAARNDGKTYQEIAAEGGGIWSTVKHTRAASQQALANAMTKRLDRLLLSGVTTVEAKSGYGLGVEEEISILRAIKSAGEAHPATVISTCLAAHIIPKDFDGGEHQYLEAILSELVPVIQQESLTNRFDIFIEENAFSIDESRWYLTQLQKLGFDLTIHGDQFSVGGSQVAVELGVCSVDHLEASGDAEIEALSKSQVIPVVLPGASLGLGMGFAPARKLLDAGCSLAIASDWNPGSAPQGDLLSQAAILGAYEKLSSAEVLAGMTVRAAAALNVQDRGQLIIGLHADLACFPTHDFREILYHQGMMKPSQVYLGGVPRL